MPVNNDCELCSTVAFFSAVNHLNGCLEQETEFHFTGFKRSCSWVVIGIIHVVMIDSFEKRKLLLVGS